MDCKLVQQKIYRFIYGECDAYELRKIKEHLEVCNQCRQECELIEDILGQLKNGLPEDPVPAGFRDRVLERIHAIADEG